jgi:RND family efflux transporter MFP subunit
MSQPGHHPPVDPNDVVFDEKPQADVGAAPPVRPMSGRRMLYIGGVVAGVLLLLLIITIIPRRSVQRELLAEAAGRDSAPSVMVTTVRRAAPGSVLTLPGTIQALHESAIYARVTGYVKRWHADLGSTVRAGEVLAEIDAPELEQEVQQAQAQLSQTRAALGLARADLERWKSLARDSAVTGQELDQKQAAYEAALANTGASEANVRRLSHMRTYTRVVAPFAGVITARNVDIGSLISPAGATSAPLSTGGAAGAPGAGSLFKVAQTDTVRTYVTVSEAYATSITPGLETDVEVQGIPGRVFRGRVARTSRSLDASSRTLLTEVDIANRDFALLPGMFARATLHFPRVTPPLVLPSSALVLRSAGPQVMVVETGTTTGQGTIHLRSVKVGRDYGSTVEIASGIIDGMSIVTNPNADLVDGQKVKIAAVPAADAPKQAGRPTAAASAH